MNFSIKIILLLIILLPSCQSGVKNQQQKNELNKDTATAQHVYTPPIIDPDLLRVWDKFKTIVATRDYKEFDKISIDKIATCDDTLDVKTFTEKCFLNVFDTVILKLMIDTSYTDYVNRSIMREYLPNYLRGKVEVHGYSFEVNQFQILKELNVDGGWTMTFDFIKTKNGYKFLGCDSYGGPICCR